MTIAAVAWLVWFVVSFGAFAAMEAHAVVFHVDDGTLSAQVKRLVAGRRQSFKALFLIAFMGGNAVLCAHFLGWLW